MNTWQAVKHHYGYLCVLCDEQNIKVLRTPGDWSTIQYCGHLVKTKLECEKHAREMNARKAATEQTNG